MNEIFIAKNEIENKAMELKELFGMSEEEIFLAMQGAFLNLANQLATKSMYDARKHEIEKKSLIAKNQELVDELDKKEKGENEDGNESTSKH